MSRSVKSGHAVVCRSCQTLGPARARFLAPNASSSACVRASRPCSSAAQAPCPSALRAQGEQFALGRTKYHFSQRRRFRRRREQTLVSSWAPVQWLRRGRRAPVTMMPSPTPRFGSCRRPPVTHPPRRGLTLPSNGHTTAGHNVPLRQEWSRRCVPLMSNVRPRRKHFPASSENLLPCIPALPPRGIAVQGGSGAGRFSDDSARSDAKCSQRQRWRGSLGRLSALGRSKYHFSQRRRFRRRREQTLISSWAPVQWLRRGRRAPVTMVPSPTPRFGCCRRPPVTQPLRRGLTLPSNGHTTAGHNVSLRQGGSRRCVPLMSNVRALQTQSSLPCAKYCSVAHRTDWCSVVDCRRAQRGPCCLKRSGRSKWQGPVVCEVPQRLGRPFELLVAGPRFGYAATSVSCWRFAPPCCAGQSVSGFGGVAKLRASHQFLQKELATCSGNRVPHRTSHEPFHSNCDGQSISGYGGLARLRATHQFLQRSWRVCSQSCSSSSIALTLPSNGQSQAGFAHL